MTESESIRSHEGKDIFKDLSNLIGNLSEKVLDGPYSNITIRKRFDSIDSESTSYFEIRLFFPHGSGIYLVDNEGLFYEYGIPDSLLQRRVQTFVWLSDIAPKIQVSTHTEQLIQIIKQHSPAV